jgi:hypothetical protein
MRSSRATANLVGTLSHACERNRGAWAAISAPVGRIVWLWQIVSEESGQPVPAKPVTWGSARKSRAALPADVL